jgi:hypothetical protein
MNWLNWLNDHGGLAGWLAILLMILLAFLQRKKWSFVMSKVKRS